MMEKVDKIIQKAINGEYGEDSLPIQHLVSVAKQVLQAKLMNDGSGLTGPFICGAFGEPGEDGLHQGYMVCPEYGVDVGYVGAYFRKEEPK